TLSKWEAELVRAKFQECTVLSGPSATIDTVKAQIQNADLLHASCHGTIDSRVDYAAVLLLANRIEFTYRELFGLSRLPSRLIILSACASGISSVGVENS